MISGVRAWIRDSSGVSGSNGKLRIDRASGTAEAGVFVCPISIPHAIVNTKPALNTRKRMSANFRTFISGFLCTDFGSRFPRYATRIVAVVGRTITRLSSVRLISAEGYCRQVTRVGDLHD